MRQVRTWLALERNVLVLAGTVLQSLSLLRKAILALLRAQGWSNVADGLRYYGASVPRALKLIGALPT